MDERDALSTEQIALSTEEDEKIALLDRQKALLDNQIALLNEQAALLDEQISLLEQQEALLDERDALLDEKIKLVEKQRARQFEKSALLRSQRKQRAMQTALLDEDVRLTDNKQEAFSTELTALLDKQKALSMWTDYTERNELFRKKDEKRVLLCKKIELLKKKTARKIALLAELKTKFEQLPTNLKAKLAAKHSIFSDYKTHTPISEATPTAIHGLFSGLMDLPKPTFEDCCRTAIGGAGIMVGVLCYRHLFSKNANGYSDSPNILYPGRG